MREGIKRERERMKERERKKERERERERCATILVESLSLRRK